MALKNKSHDIDKAVTTQPAPEQIALDSNERLRTMNPAVALQRAANSHPAALKPVDILALQRTIGNRAVGRILASQPNALPPQPANAIQRKTEEEESLQAKLETDGKAENKTGLPANLKAGIERLSGMAMDDVRVHYNSSAPARVQALAYTQGTNIHLGPNQERHLPHEAWHVVQQKQGRVKPTLQAKGVAINDDQALEREAGELGARSLQTNLAPVSGLTPNGSLSSGISTSAPAQRVIQRVISYATPGNPGKAQLDTDLGANTKAVSRFTHGESLSNTWGAASSTKNFTNANNSEKLSDVNINWGGTKIGYLRPIGRPAGFGGFESGVKMHLVNSYLHSDANNWAENWVWGHGSLNHAHEGSIESVAKDYHPHAPKHTLTSGKAIYALNYRTEVTAKAADWGKTDDDMADDIVAGINRTAPVNWTGTNRLRVKANVDIAGQDISTYHGLWQNAIANTVASKVTSYARIYGVDANGTDIEAEDVVLGPGSVEEKAKVEYRVVIERDGQWFAGQNPPIFTPPLSRPKRKIDGGGGGSTSGGGSSSGTGSNKKIKTG
jgi:uncharacterized protein DUF4157